MNPRTPRSRMLICSLAAALAVCPLALGQETRMEQRKPGPMPQHGNPGGQPDNVAQDVATRDRGVGMMAGNAKADQVVNSQLMAYAQNPDATEDQCFALKAAAGNMTEIETSRVVANKATDPQIKQLAQTILDQHRQAQDKLAPIAKRLGVTLPDQLPTMHQAEVTTLQNLSPEDAGKAYVAMMRNEHLKAVSMYEAKIPKIKDAELKAYATETLPHIRMHTGQILSTANNAGMPLDLSFQQTGAGGGMHNGMNH